MMQRTMRILLTSSPCEASLAAVHRVRGAAPLAHPAGSRSTNGTAASRRMWIGPSSQHRMLAAAGDQGGH